VKGMILTAGLGTRLRPLSLEIPKPVVPVLGRPLCTYNIEFLRRSGVREFLLNLHTKPKLIQQRVTGWVGGKIPVRYTLEPLILGTGGGIRNAADFLREDTFVAMNGDTVLRFPFASALAFHRERRALATLVLLPDPRKRYTPVWTDGEGRITGFGDEAGEGIRSGFYTGCQIAEPELLSRIPKRGGSCIIRETYMPLVREKAPVFGYPATGSFFEFGSPADYLQGTLELLHEGFGKKPDRSLTTGSVDIVSPVHIAPGAKVGAGARIGPDAVLEEGSTVGEGAVVSRAILWPRASVAPGEVLHGAVVTPRSRISIPDGPPPTA
jgi:NDP-sugar pyrophosphorylase family protein